MLKFLGRLFLITILFTLLAGAGVWWFILKPIKLQTSPLDFTVSPGSSLRGAAQQVEKAGVSLNPLVLVVLGRVLGVDSQIKAGSYEIQRGITPIELLDKMTRGDITQSEIMFVEGHTFRQWREKLDAHPNVKHELAGLNEADVMKFIGANEVTAEGRFYPDTYLFAKGSSDKEILARAYRAMQRHLIREWSLKPAGLPYQTPNEALIMASIVEKETGSANDRAMIASVFVNRLRLGMPLQTDPTVIYGLGEHFDGNLHKADLLADTPYNTYTRGGLPPGPIAMPGLASLRAALHPAMSDALYFVARGDGSSQFSRTLEEHNQAVARYQLKSGKTATSQKTMNGNP